MIICKKFQVYYNHSKCFKVRKLSFQNTEFFRQVLELGQSYKIDPIQVRKLKLIESMKKIPKIVTNTAKNNNSQSIASKMVNSLGMGMIAGLFFQGSFIMFGFQSRVVKGVTSNQLQQIQKMDQNVQQSIAKGQVPKTAVDLLTKQVRVKVQKKLIDLQNKKA